MKNIAILLFFLPILLWSNPWGKDEDLAYSWPKRGHWEELVSPVEPGVLAKVGENLIHFHQNVISPADGPRSHFKPSSSQYTIDAIRKYGFFEGVAWGCDRLMRENSDPWIYPKVKGDYGDNMKYDPVR